MNSPGSYAIFSHSLATVRNNLGVAWAVFWPWAVFVFIIYNLYLLLIVVVAGPGGNTLGFDLLLAVIQFIVVSSIAVNWHRFVLIDEMPDGIDERLRLDLIVWRYAGNLLLAYLVLFLLLGFGVLVLTVGDRVVGAQEPATSVIAASAVVLYALFSLWSSTFFYRLVVKLPAVAVGRSDYGFRQALADTKGRSLTFFGLLVLNILVVLGALAVIGAIVFALSQISYLLAGIVGFALYVVFAWFFTIFNVSQLTTLYGVYAEGREL